jgi:methylase of polypeptide subunit release factors
MSLKSLGSSISDLEYGEADFARWVGEAMPEDGRNAWFVGVANAMVCRRADDLGVSADGLMFGAQKPIDAPEVRRAAGEAHALGWLHQHVGAPARRASQAAHHHREAKHPAQETTTQLYTPRWVADILVERSLRARRSEEPSTWFDPAVGGGQMLLAAADAIHRQTPDIEPEEVARRLSGCDIDPRAVQVARTGLKLHFAERFGRRDPAAEAILDRQVCQADGLIDDAPERVGGNRPDIVLTNPPYMGSRSMPEPLKARLRDGFRPYHRDLYAAFIDRCHDLSDDVVAVLAQQTIWYLKRFAAARRDLLKRGGLKDFVHLGTGVFRTLSGEKANVVAFVQTVGSLDDAQAPPKTDFVDLRDIEGADEKRRAYAQSDHRQRISVDDFSKMPGQPMAHGCPAVLRKTFGGRRLTDIADVPGSQNKTGDNGTYLRSWRDVDASTLHTEPMDIEPSLDAADPVGTSDAGPDASNARWYFYSKGGRYAPWWGNWDSVIDWSDSARNFYRDNGTSNLLAPEYRFREGLCYTDFGGADFNARWMPPGCLFDMAGPAIFPNSDWLEEGQDSRSRLFALLALLNSSPVRRLLNAMNPSLHYQVSDLRELPVPAWDAQTERRLADGAIELIRGYRALAAQTKPSPVGSLTSGEVSGDVGLETLRRREAQLDAVVCQLYGWSPEGEVDRRDHRYA